MCGGEMTAERRTPGTFSRTQPVERREETLVGVPSQRA